MVLLKMLENETNNHNSENELISYSITTNNFLYLIGLPWRMNDNPSQDCYFKACQLQQKLLFYTLIYAS